MSGTFDAEDQRPHSVYMVLDESLQTLYVGCARNVKERMRMHLEPSSQSPASWVIQQRWAFYGEREMPSKAEARELERRVIREEMPLLNKQHNPRYRKNVRELPIVPRARAA
jgi:excinuclease UvrABC nuclease subunit